MALPPAVVFYDGECYWLADGYHRIYAAERNGWTTYPCEVRQGTRRDAVLFSVGANDSHGLRRTNQDKRRAVEKLLRDEEWKEWSDSDIGRQCAVAHSFVWKIRQEIYPSPVSKTSERTYKTKHGTTAKMKTGNIGRSSSPSPVLLPQAQSTLGAPVEIEDLQRETALQLRQQGMTQEKAAAVVGVTQKTVDNWESKAVSESVSNSTNAYVPPTRVSVPRSSHAQTKVRSPYPVRIWPRNF